jgi:hypothetical protein
MINITKDDLSGFGKGRICHLGETMIRDTPGIFSAWR